jgi:hypothetical protein
LIVETDRAIEFPHQAEMLRSYCKHGVEKWRTGHGQRRQYGSEVLDCVGMIEPWSQISDVVSHQSGFLLCLERPQCVVEMAR